MTDEHKRHLTLGHLAALMALPMLIVLASISASNTQQEVAGMDNPAAMYGAATPAGTPEDAH